MSKLLELVTRFEQLTADRDAVQKEIVSFVGTSAAVAPAPVAAEPAKAKRGRKPAVHSDTPKADGDSTKRQSMKSLVQEILSRKRDGMELKGIVDEVKRLIEAGEYKTTSTNVPPLVQQALHQLKNHKLIQVDKTEGNRNVYRPAAA